MIASERDRLLYEITAAQKTLASVVDHPIMSSAIRGKIEQLTLELANLEGHRPEGRAILYFYGGPVRGTQGIEAAFLSDTLSPFQQMVTARVSNMWGRVAKKGKIMDANRSKLFLTSLPRGSFGVELTKIDRIDLFDGDDLSQSMRNVIELIDSTKNVETFASESVTASNRELSALKKFFAVLNKNHAGIRLETDGFTSEFSKEEVELAYGIISRNIEDVDTIQIIGRFTGIFLKSRTFEFMANTDQKITGAINNEITDEDVESYGRDFLDRECIGTFEKKIVNHVDGDAKPVYILLALDEVEP